MSDVAVDLLRECVFVEWPCARESARPIWHVFLVASEMQCNKEVVMDYETYHTLKAKVQMVSKRCYMARRGGRAEAPRQALCALAGVQLGRENRDRSVSTKSAAAGMARATRRLSESSSVSARMVARQCEWRERLVACGPVALGSSALPRGARVLWEEALQQSSHNSLPVGGRLRHLARHGSQCRGRPPLQQTCRLAEPEDERQAPHSIRRSPLCGEAYGKERLRHRAICTGSEAPAPRLLSQHRHTLRPQRRGPHWLVATWLFPRRRRWAGGGRLRQRASQFSQLVLDGRDRVGGWNSLPNSPRATRLLGWATVRLHSASASRLLNALNRPAAFAPPRGV